MEENYLPHCASWQSCLPNLEESDSLPFYPGYEATFYSQLFYNKANILISN